MTDEFPMSQVSVSTALNKNLYGDHFRDRSWRERLFTRPWRPWVKKARVVTTLNVGLWALNAKNEFEKMKSMDAFLRLDE